MPDVVFWFAATVCFVLVYWFFGGAFARVRWSVFESWYRRAKFGLPGTKLPLLRWLFWPDAAWQSSYKAASIWRMFYWQAVATGLPERYDYHKGSYILCTRLAFPVPLLVMAMSLPVLAIHAVWDGFRFLFGKATYVRPW